jgi:hypothetical protein
MTKQFAKISIEYIDYLIDLSDTQAFLNIMSKATRLTTRHDMHQDRYITVRDGGANVIVCFPTEEEASAPIYDRNKEE